MLSPAQILAVLAVVPTAALVASCVADVSDDTAQVSQAVRDPELQPEGVHWGRGPDLPPKKTADGPADDDYGIPPGPCRTACRLVMREGCGDWLDDCAGEEASAELVTCGPTYLTCGAARHAMQGTRSGQMWCYLDCLSLD